MSIEDNIAQTTSELVVESPSTLEDFEPITEDSIPNPISTKYAGVARSFLEIHIGQRISQETIDYLSNLLATTVVELAGLSEAAEILDISRQRAHQLKDQMANPVAKLRATPVWLVEDIQRYSQERRIQLELYWSSGSS